MSTDGRPSLQLPLRPCRGRKQQPAQRCPTGDEAEAASGARDVSALDQIWATAQTVGGDVVVASAAVPTHRLEIRLVGRALLRFVHSASQFGLQPARCEAFCGFRRCTPRVIGRPRLRCCAWRGSPGLGLRPAG